MILPTCREVSAAAARGELSPLGRLHLLLCASCRRFRRQIGLIAQAMKSAVFAQADAARAKALEEKILTRLRGL